MQCIDTQRQDKMSTAQGKNNTHTQREREREREIFGDLLDLSGNAITHVCCVILIRK